MRFLLSIFLCILAVIIHVAAETCHSPPCSDDPFNPTLMESPHKEKCTSTADCVSVANARAYCFNERCFYDIP